MSGSPRENADPSALPGDLEAARPHPLLYPVIAFIVGVSVSEYLGVAPADVRIYVLVLGVMSILTAFALARQRRVAPYFAGVLVIFAAGLFGFARHQSELHLPTNHVSHYLTNEPVLTRISARILTPPQSAPAQAYNPFLPEAPSPRVRFVAEARELLTTDPSTPIYGLVRVSVEAEKLDAAAGDLVTLTGKLYRPIGPRNPGETDWARWNRDQRIYACMSIEDGVHVRKTGTVGLGPVAAASLWLRERAQRLLLESFTPEDDGRAPRLLDAMVLGQRSSATRELNDIFLRSGALHFLAVSGFHVGVLMAAAWWLLHRAAGLSTRITAAIMLVMLLLYALLAEANAPILRAATMGVLFCAALLTRRPFCGWNWLALSALCILCYNPFELFRAGFQLSFVQVIAIFTLVPRTHRFVTRRVIGYAGDADADSWGGYIFRVVYRFVIGLIVVCTVAWLVALPLVCWHFGRVAPWGAVQSVMISPLVMVTIVLGFAALVTQAIPSAAIVTGALLHGATAMLLKSADWLSGWPWALIEPPAPPAWLAVASYALLAAGYVLSRRGQPKVENVPPPVERRIPDRKRLTALGAGAVYAGVWLAWVLLAPTPRRDDPTLCVLSVGNGLCTLLKLPGGHAFVYDVGTIHNSDAGETARRAARAMGVRRLDFLALSHFNFDHYSGLPTLLKEWPPDAILTNAYDHSMLKEHEPIRAALSTSRAPPKIVVRQAGESIAFPTKDAEEPRGDVLVEVLWPPADLPDSWRANDRSLVLRVTINGGRLLLTGDIERPALRELANRHIAGSLDLGADVLIAPHHGSVVPRDTEAFYKLVAPRIVINSAADRRPKLVALLSSAFGDGVRLYSTDENGAVLVNFKSDGELIVETAFATSR